MKYLLIMAGLLLSNGLAFSQNYITAYQLTSTEFGGTSRYNAMAGSFGALGGDVSSLSHNPAGIGLFRRSELSVTPALQINTISSDYLGTNSEELKPNANFNNLAFVSSKKLDDDLWKNVQFGISYNRIKDFHSAESIIGINEGTTFADQLASSAFGIESDDFESFNRIYLYPAWQTYVFDPSDVDLEYVSGFTDNDVKQVYTRETTGRISETAVTLGTNYNDRLYLGATIGFQRLKFNDESTFLESAEYDLEGSELSSYRFIYSENAVGDGFNLKLGAIYRINDLVRAGIAYHSPTFISMNTSTERRFSSVLADGQTLNESAPTQINEYNLSSPSKLIGSLAFIINKQGVLNIDYEMADYSKMKLRPSGQIGNDFSDDNQEIKTYFQSTNNVRVGGEVRLQPFSLRAGVAYYENPNKDGTSLYAADKLFYTGGIGYKRKDMYVDFAYRLRSTKEDKYLYSSDFSEPIQQEFTGSSISATWGVRF